MQRLVSPNDCSTPGKDNLEGLVQETAERVNAKVAAGKTISILQKLETDGHCGLETSSVYGAVVALPQIARSSGWAGTFTNLAARSYMLLLINIFLQCFLLSMIGTEQLIMYPFAGQMHLCNFGAQVASCGEEGATDCLGPGGTTYSYPRLYDYDIWSTRIFLRESLKSLFPKMQSAIMKTADPGEYGLESSWCRAVCILIFMVAVANDLYGTIGMARLLMRVPTRPDSWITYEPPAWAPKEEAKALHGWSELDLVKIRVAGMPMAWKLVNFVLVLVPKFALWNALVLSGVHYLMETAGIVDVIVNSMALNFVLNVDEMIFARLASTMSKHLMASLEDMALFDMEDEETQTPDEVLKRYQESELGRSRVWKALNVFPTQLAIVILLQGLFTWIYFVKNCVRTEDGSWVSADLREPQMSSNFISLMFGMEQVSEGAQTFWSMPSKK